MIGGSGLVIPRSQENWRTPSRRLGFLRQHNAVTDYTAPAHIRANGAQQLQQIAELTLHRLLDLAWP